MRAALLLLLLQASSTVPTASISGLVTEAGAPYLHPLFNARVELVGESIPNVGVRTGADGRFMFSSLRAGRYRLQITADGYLRKNLNIVVPQGKSNDVRIDLSTAPTMFGHIKDRNNVPVSNTLVEALKVGYGPRGDRTITSLESALTDDRGEYHLYWLDNGEYYIRANPASATYYPGTRNIKEAITVRLRAGSTYGPLDFRLQANISAGISGFISTADGPGYIGICHADVFVTPAGAAASVQQFRGRSSCKEDPLGVGFYGVTGFSPGVYVVSSDFTLDGVQWTLHRKMEVKALDRGMSLILVAGTTVHGQIVIESGGAFDLRALKFALDSTDPDLPSPHEVQVDGKGMFQASRVEPGDFTPRVFNLPGDAYVKFAKSSGDSRPIHVESSPLELGQIMLATNGGHMEGSVVDDSGQPVAGAAVVLVPDAERRSSPQQYRTAESDLDGRFILHGIPPGEYKVFAWESGEENAYLNADYLRNYESLGIPLIIEPSSALSATLRIILQN